MGELLRERNIKESVKIMAFLSLLLFQPNVASAQKKSYIGYVQDAETGLPIERAKVIVMKRSYRWRFHRGWEQLYCLETGEDCRFQFRCEEDEALQIRAYKADPSTPSYDYMPIVMHIDSLETTEKLNISLRKAATQERADSLGIALVYLPPHSPDLNPHKTGVEGHTQEDTPGLSKR